MATQTTTIDYEIQRRRGAVVYWEAATRAQAVAHADEWAVAKAEWLARAEGSGSWAVVRAIVRLVPAIERTSTLHASYGGDFVADFCRVPVGDLIAQLAMADGTILSRLLFDDQARTETLVLVARGGVMRDLMAVLKVTP